MIKLTSTIAIALFAIGMFLPQYALSQAPEKMSYQSVIRNDSGDLVVEGLVGLQISILQGSAEGVAAYVETHSVTTNVNGLVSLELGMGTMIMGTFTGIDWRNGPYFVKSDIDPSGGSTYSMSATSELLSVPYAIHSSTSGDNQWSESGSGINTSSFSVGINSSSPQHTLDVRSLSQADAAGLNVSNDDRSRYVRFYSGSEMFPDPSMSWAPNRNFVFATYDDNTFEFQEKIRISSIGYVGIGIADPQAKLDILGGNWNLDAGNPGDLRIGNAINNFRIGIATGGGGAGITRMYTNSNALILGANDTPSLILEADGRITAPNLSESLIAAEGNKSLVTKEYVDNYSEEKTITISASAFNPSSNAAAFVLNSGTKAYCTSSNSYLYAPITLPAGTIIKEISAYTFDSNASNDLQFSVGYAYNLGGQTPSLKFTLNTSGSSGLQILTHTTDFTISDNNQYHIRIHPSSGDVWNGSDLSIAQVRITYME